MISVAVLKMRRCTIISEVFGIKMVPIKTFSSLSKFSQIVVIKMYIQVIVHLVYIIVILFLEVLP